MKKFITSLLLILNCIVVAFSQKLPAKQETGVYAPSNVKLDGKITEWGNLQAYNQATEISYTMANDNDKLYFICSATVEDVIQKIIVGGITLTISSSDKKTDNIPVAITYPIVPFLKAQINYDIRPPAPLKESVVSSINDKISNYLKEIKVTGIKDFPEGSIPVYNDQGISGAQYIGSNKVYICELTLPLKFFSHLINKDTFNYKVQLNGMDKNVITVGGSSLGGPASSNQPAPNGPTYFNASYTLTKK